MKKKIDPVVDEAIERLNMQDGPSRRRLLEGAGLFSATAAASALIAACTSSSSSSATPTSAASSSAAVVGNFPKTPAWQFWFVNHVTTNLFFVPTQYGMKDAAALLGLPAPKWGGSANSLVTEMVSYLDSAISASANGIATTVIDSHSFTTPVANAMNAGIPVITYNADGTVGAGGVADISTNRLCYVGQALYLSGQQMGQRIKSLVTTPGEVVIFIATPGSGNIQPRSDGAQAVLKPAGYTVRQIATGALTSAESSAEKAFLIGAKSTLKGAFAVDAGSTELLGPALASVGLKIPAGGFDLTPGTLNAIQAGQLNFTINQDPYLQGFLPVMYLYLFNLTGGLAAAPDTDTGLTFVDKSNVSQYLKTSTTYLGSTGATRPTLVPRSGPITNPVGTTST